MNNYTNTYERRAEQVDSNIFTEEFFSGTDTSIYINDVKVDFISYINYSLQEQQKPIYGYASRTFDDTAVGSRIVIGSIKVPISNPEQNTLLEFLKQNEDVIVNEYNEALDNNTIEPVWVSNYKKGAN